MSSDKLAPIIIKRKKVIAGGGHHGGAWKVAYADFVTAMMAFFLLMWLLNATTEKQRKGLADYFSPTIPMSRVSGGGDGALWGDNVFAEDRMPQKAKGSSLESPSKQGKAKGDFGLEERPATSAEGQNTGLAAAEDLLEALKARGGESMAKLASERHVVTRLSDEGLVIEVFDTDDSLLFLPGTASPTPELLGTLATIGELLQLVTNDIAVGAFLARRPVVFRPGPVWDLTTSRADVTRAALEHSGLNPERVQRVTGYGDRKPVERNTTSLRNNRVEITVLRDDI